MIYFSYICIFLSITTAARSAEDEGLISQLLSPGPLSLVHKDSEMFGCLSCHTAGSGVPQNKCLECHKEISKQLKRKKSFHATTKKKCIQCHSDHKGINWDTTKINQDSFSHKKTGYELSFKHEKVQCSKCHTEKRSKKHFRKTAPRYLGVSQKCSSCHKKDDVHFFDKALKKQWHKKDCKSCHSLKGWKKEVNFNHEKETEFKLSLPHKKAKCSSCHLPNGPKKRAIYNWPKLKEKKCLTCHKDTHKEGLNKKFRLKSCDHCHSDNTFTIKKFDHNISTFKLKNKHAKTDCTKCHKTFSQQKYKKKRLTKWSVEKASCKSCHKSPHRGQFKKENFKLKCNTCHTTKGFNNEEQFSKKYDHDKTNFKLNFKHRKTACKKCHKKVQSPKVFKLNKFFPRGIPNFSFPKLDPMACNSCHKDPHKGSLGNTCTKCHSDRDWKIAKDFHKNFALQGIHFSLGCVECHKQDRSLKGLSNECQLCHQKDDIHQGSLPSCQECHKQSIWNITSFQHSLTNFPLRGVHRTLNCIECHRGGIYQGGVSECSDCHIKDAMKVSSPPHIMPTMQDCSRCHNQFKF